MPLDFATQAEPIDGPDFSQQSDPIATNLDFSAQSERIEPFSPAEVAATELPPMTEIVGGIPVNLEKESQKVMEESLDQRSLRTTELPPDFVKRATSFQLNPSEIVRPQEIPFELVPMKESKGTGTLAGIQRSVAKLANGLLSEPNNVFLLGIAGLGAIPAKAVAAYFAASALKSIPELAKYAGENWDKMNSGQRAEAIADLVATGLVTTGAGMAVKSGTPLPQAIRESVPEIVNTPEFKQFEAEQAKAAEPKLETLAPATAEAIKEIIPETKGETYDTQNRPANVESTEPQRQEPGNVAQPEGGTEATETGRVVQTPQVKVEDYVPEEPTEVLVKGEEFKPAAKPLSVGPGAQTVGEPPKSQIEQLTDAFKGIEGKKLSFGQQVKEAFSFGEALSNAKDAVSRSVQGLKTAGDYLKQKISSFRTVDEMLAAKGDLSAELEKRGWRLREFVKTVSSHLKDKNERAAIAKWVDAGGDLAELERGATETKPEYRKHYEDALKLSEDALLAAKNIRNYFEARLQEAIDAGVIEAGVTDYIHRIYENNPKARDAAIAYVQSGILSKNPRLARKRVFQFDWEAEKLGYRPVQDFLPRIAQYEASLSKAITARAFIKKATTMAADDGRPIVGVKGVGVPIESAEGIPEATLIKPSVNPKAEVGTKGYRGDYVNREYPALSKWKWVASDTAGKPILIQGDVAIHPKYVERIDALLKPSALRTGRLGRIMQPAARLSSTVKQTMLDLSFFHQVQIAVHAAEHRVMPWKILKEIDFENKDVDGLLRGGVTLGGDFYGGIHAEGLVGRSLSRAIPGLGPLMESYHELLFQSFIPRVKMTMALHALERNRKRFASDLKSGKMKEADLYHETANEANAAFGELNYVMLERSKTAQDLARIILLAPDFLEARGRFAGQAFTKYGKEQRVALLLGALTMWTLARIGNKALDDQFHLEPENLFSLVIGGRRYSLRTVQGDILHLIDKPMQFWTSRLNPVYGRTTLEALTGRDYFGRKRSFSEQAWDAVSTVIPISMRFGRERSLMESIFNSFGITARRWNDVDTVYKLAAKWKEKNGISEKGEFIYDADKDPLRPLKIALSLGDEPASVKELKRLLDSGKTDSNKLGQYFKRYASAPFAGSKQNDLKFQASLSEDEKKTYTAAVQHRQAMRLLYLNALSQYLAAKNKK